MHEERVSFAARRGFLKLVGGSAALLPLTAIVGCSGDRTPAATTAAPPAPLPAPTPVAAAPELTTPPPAIELVELSENDPTAQALGYRHDATQVDASKHPRFAPGQNCSNCVQYRGAPGDAWGPCNLFPGKRVNAAGWCSGYAPKA